MAASGLTTIRSPSGWTLKELLETLGAAGCALTFLETFDFFFITNAFLKLVTGLPPSWRWSHYRGIWQETQLTKHD
jgi:hypothetical protein